MTEDVSGFPRGTWKLNTEIDFLGVYVERADRIADLLIHIELTTKSVPFLSGFNLLCDCATEKFQGSNDVQISYGVAFYSIDIAPGL